MLSNYRLLLIASFGGLILSSAGNADPKASSNKAATEQSVSNTPQSVVPPDRFPPTAVISTDRLAEACKPGDDRRHSELCAQWKAADAAADSAWWAWLAAISSVVGTVAVLIALYLAYQANAIVSDTAKRQLRAYVTLRELEIVKPISENVLNARAIFRNSGQTPAKTFKSHVRGVVMINPHSDSDIPVISENEHVYSSGSIGAGQDVNNVLDLDITAECAQFILRNEATAYIFGWIKYEDIFGAWQTTNFRMRFDAKKGQWVIHASGNTVT